MNFLLKISIYCVLINSSALLGQLGFQAGYDYVVIKLPSVNTTTFTEKKSFNDLHRVNILTYYKLDNNLLFSFGLGHDKYMRDKESLQRLYIETNNTCSIKSTRFSAEFNTFRFELSAGYSFKLNEKLSFVPKLTIESLVLNKINNDSPQSYQ